MRIDYINIDSASKEVYLHDFYISSMIPNLEEQTLKLVFRPNYIKKERKVYLTFEGVIFYEMSMCNPSSKTIDTDCLFSRTENNGIHLRFVGAMKEWDDRHRTRAADVAISEKMIYPAVLFISGDVLQVICTSIEYIEEN